MQVSMQHATLLLEELDSTTQETGLFKQTHFSSSVSTYPWNSSASSSRPAACRHQGCCIGAQALQADAGGYIQKRGQSNRPPGDSCGHLLGPLVVM